MISASVSCIPNLISPIAKSNSPQNLVSIPLQRNSDFEALKSNLIHHANVGNFKQATSTLDLMARQGFAPDLTSYSVLLKSCIRTRNFHLGKLVHEMLFNSELELDSIVLNSLISLYSKCGDWVTARTIFENMGEKRDLVSWSAMISCYARSGMELEAVLTFFGMVESGEYPNQFCYSSVVQACSNVEYAWIGSVIFGFLLKTGHFNSDVCVGCSLIDLFSKGFGDLGAAKKVFDLMTERNSVSWTLMITRTSQLGSPINAIELFLEMILSGFVPDKFTYSSVLSACAELEWSLFGPQLHTSVVKYGLTTDVCVGCSLVDMYAKCAGDGSMVNSRKIFDRMPVHNVMSWTAIITGYALNGNTNVEAIELYCKMMEDGSVKPNHFTFSGLLKACANFNNLDMGIKIHCHAVKLGLASINCVGNALINMYSRCDRIEEAQKAFDVLFEKNLVSYNTFVDTCVKNSNIDKAFEVSNKIENTKFGIDAFTFASLLSGAASVGALGKGELIHARLLKAGFESNQCVCNSLISMYARCGSLESSLRVFNGMEDHNIVSWTAIITGYAKFGYAKKALELFTDMIKAGVKPNEVTYIAVLSACSHAGFIEEGWEFFHSMSKDHGIVPRMEHYACMVDLLGRSGLLQNAVEFISSMPYTPGAIVWRTLLGACRVYGDTKLGKLAAEMILQQEPNDPAAHVLLSNMYASEGQWEKVGKIRQGMKEKKLVKEAGCSWIEVENNVHKFYVGDTKHPESELIYEHLDQLVMKIKEMGYVPDTNVVLHEVEDDEQKENYLIQHSEKIAVVFGLINTNKQKAIRIFKNLRVCGDCHTAMKYISVATGREIVVRDSNRFHHIKNGSCSCNDYW